MDKSTNNLVKKPVNGGIPAIERSEIVKAIEKKALNLKLEKEYNTLK